jgi:hypothetical protein
MRWRPGWQVDDLVVKADLSVGDTVVLLPRCTSRANPITVKVTSLAICEQQTYLVGLADGETRSFGRGTRVLSREKNTQNQDNVQLKEGVTFGEN